MNQKSNTKVEQISRLRATHLYDKYVNRESNEKSIGKTSFFILSFCNFSS